MRSRITSLAQAANPSGVHDHLGPATSLSLRFRVSDTGGDTLRDETALELVPKYEKYLWRRLTVIVGEDIGVANPIALGLIPQIAEAYFQFRKWGKDGSARLALANAILLLARSPKSTLADHLQCVVSDRDAGLRLAIPDYALDKHTRKGRALRRGVEHWIEEDCGLIPIPTEPDPYREEAAERWKAGYHGRNFDKNSTRGESVEHRVKTSRTLFP